LRRLWRCWDWWRMRKTSGRHRRCRERASEELFAESTDKAGGMVSDKATINYPVMAYVFQGEECNAVRTIGDEGQTPNVPLVEGTYSVYAIEGASTDDYVLLNASDSLTSSAIALCEGMSMAT